VPEVLIGGGQSNHHDVVNSLSFPHYLIRSSCVNSSHVTQCPLSFITVHHSFLCDLLSLIGSDHRCACLTAAYHINQKFCTTWWCLIALPVPWVREKWTQPKMVFGLRCIKTSSCPKVEMTAWFHKRVSFFSAWATSYTCCRWDQREFRFWTPRYSFITNFH